MELVGVHARVQAAFHDVLQRSARPPWHDALRMAPGVALGFPGLVVLRGRGTRGEQLCHEVAAEAVHLVKERLLELRRAGDAVALNGLRGGIDDGVDPRGAPQDELRDFF